MAGRTPQDRQGEFFTEQTAGMFAQDVNRTLKVPTVRVFRVVPHRLGTVWEPAELSERN